jgi:hypothetical protein
MKFCAITPTRGDRPEFLAHCRHQMERMTVQPDKWYLINHAPINGQIDIVSRVWGGMQMAKQDGFEWCFIVEDDDFYPSNYFERFQPFMERSDFIGQEYSFYYNLRNLTYNRFDHRYRSSLFITAFRISAMELFDWPDPDTKFLDIEIWKHARHKRRKFIETGAIGIKHGVGLVGGKGHQGFWPKNNDRDFKWLAGKVDGESLAFYREMSNKLQMQPA